MKNGSAGGGSDRYPATLCIPVYYCPCFVLSDAGEFHCALAGVAFEEFW
jgi:hypothetical protein